MTLGGDNRDFGAEEASLFTEPEVTPNPPGEDQVHNPAHAKTGDSTATDDAMDAIILA